MKKRVGLFGGTFNPVHHGHINLALELKEKNDLEEVWFIPAHLSPFRIGEKDNLTPFHRLNMLEQAFRDINFFKISTIEIDRPPPSFTIDTLKALQQHHPECTFFLLLGEDLLRRFHEWKEPLEIVRCIPLLIGSRRDSELLKTLPALKFEGEINAAILKGMQPTKQLEISATEIRNRLKEKLYCGHLLSGKVLDYIYQNQLYSYV